MRVMMCYDDNNNDDNNNNKHSNNSNTNGCNTIRNSNGCQGGAVIKGTITL